MARIGNVGRSYWEQWKQQCGMFIRYNCTLCPFLSPNIGTTLKMKPIRNDIGSALPFMLRKKNMEEQLFAKLARPGLQIRHVNRMVVNFFQHIEFLWNVGAVRTAATNVNKTLLKYMFLAFQIKKGWSPDLNDLSLDWSLRHPFFEQKHSVKLENFGLYKKGNSDCHVAGGSKLKYISIEDFMWFFYRVPKEYKKGIYNYMLKQQICVLENSPVTLLKHSVVVCFWEAPDDGWYKLNVSGVFKENLDGTIEASCGAVLRDSRGTILEVIHIPLLDASSRFEVLLAAVYYGLNDRFCWRSEVKKIILELDELRIVNALRCGGYFPFWLFDDPPSLTCAECYVQTFNMLGTFDDVKFVSQGSQGNSLANRVAYIALYLNAGQIFPICEIGYKTQVMCDKRKAPKYEIVPEKCFDDDEYSDEDEEEEWSEEEYKDEVI